MEIKTAEFVTSMSAYAAPDPALPQIAVAGKSNVGKSSLINSLCRRKALAKTSATPGKTLLINHFLVDDIYYIVDLPGYGFAKRSKSVQQDIQRIINTYILQREQLVNVFLLIDLRHDPQKIDMEFINWLGENGIPFSIVFTKADKLGPVRARQNADKYMQSLLETWETLPPYFITSSEKKQGREELLAYIQEIIQQ
jgi:GTP-binding protein